MFNSINTLKAEKIQLQYDLNKTEQNFFAATDSIQKWKSKTGEYMTEKGLLLGTVEELSKANIGLKNKVKSLNDKVLSLTEIVGSFSKNDFDTKLKEQNQNGDNHTFV